MQKLSPWRGASEQASWAPGKPCPSQEPPLPYPTSAPQAFPISGSPAFTPVPACPGGPSSTPDGTSTHQVPGKGIVEGVCDPAFLPSPRPHGHRDLPTLALSPLVSADCSWRECSPAMEGQWGGAFTDLGTRHPLVLVLALPLTSCVTEGTWLSCLEPVCEMGMRTASLGGLRSLCHMADSQFTVI